MKEHVTPLVDDHLRAFEGLQEAGTDDFFYSRLVARMENNTEEKGWNFPLKPVWVIGSLALLLLVNSFILLQDNRSSNTKDSADIQSFARSYDQAVSSSY